MYDKMLVILDGSKEAESILGRTAVLAAKHKAEVVLMMVLPVPMLVIENGRLIATIDQEEERMRAEVEPYLAKWRSRFEEGGINTSTAVRFGHVPEQVAEYAKENAIDLIVVATREQKGLDRLLRRDVAQKIVHAVSTTPVLLMKAA